MTYEAERRAREGRSEVAVCGVEMPPRHRGPAWAEGTVSQNDEALLRLVPTGGVCSARTSPPRCELERILAHGKRRLCRKESAHEDVHVYLRRRDRKQK